MNEYENEPVRGLPERLPEGENMVWQGTPRWQGLARRAFHTRTAAAYFGLLACAHVVLSTQAGMPVAEALKGAGWLAVLGGTVVGLLTLLGWLYGRTTVYTITDQRLVLRFGVAIPMMINIPWDKVEAADLKRFDDASGDIVLKLAPGQRTAYWLIWPHARPWHFSPAQPMLRCIPQAERVADLLAGVIRSQAGETVEVPLAADDGRAKRPAPPRGAHTAALS